jgi:hypothetical protein
MMAIKTTMRITLPHLLSLTNTRANISSMNWLRLIRSMPLPSSIIMQKLRNTALMSHSLQSSCAQAPHRLSSSDTTSGTGHLG